MPDLFVIAEDLPSGAKRVELSGSDLPHALPRAFAAFHSGGPVEHEEIYLPGSEDPIYQIQQARQRPMVVKGAFRDHLWINEGGTGTHHARKMRDALEEIRHRANPLVMTWAGESRRGFLAEADFGEESEFEIPYELTFKIAKGVQASPAAAATRTGRTSAVDTATELRRIVAARRAQVAAIASRLAARDVLTTVATSLDAVDAALAAVGSVAATLLSAGARDLAGPVKGLLAAVTTAQAAARAASATLAASATTAVPASDPGALAGWWGVLHGGTEDLAGVVDALRTIAAESRTMVRSAVRLYRVGPGDTLESIAQRTLGSASRVVDLGIRPEDLVVGALIRLPEAA